MAQHRRNEFDVTDQIKTTDHQQVAAAICAIYQELYQQQADPSLTQAFDDLVRLYRGELPGYHACDTDYHDVQHVLDVTLAMARLMDGCKRATNIADLDEYMFRLGIVAALYHDVGYIRNRHDRKHKNGAEYTTTHVRRGVNFLESYLPTIGMDKDARAAARMLHYTGYEVPVSSIRISLKYQLLGSLLGSADILAQMADRCYLEKVHDRLYPEFLLGGIARKTDDKGQEVVVFESAPDLLFKTPGFYKGASKRLDQDLGSSYNYLDRHFGGQNLYMDELSKNIEYARQIAQLRDLSLLRRHMPATLMDEHGNPVSGSSDAAAG